MRGTCRRPRRARRRSRRRR
uniref:Uncharacterized protein n=1 Tax=Arundo donax TaxID=35708 RepID=A0A0A9GVM5_ARUDO